MCQAISGVAVYAEGRVTVYTCPDTDSHSDIRERHNIRDGGTAGASRQSPCELIPVRGLFDLADMDFAWDAEKPQWATSEIEAECARQLHRAWLARWDADRRVLDFGGDLYLYSLASLPEGVALSAGGYLDLHSLASLPEGVTLSAGGDLYLNSLASLPEGVNIRSREMYYRGKWQPAPCGRVRT